jgi:hypothetical protein
MRFMVIVKATEETEAEVQPKPEDLGEMGAFNEQLVQAGVMLAAEGLQASSTGARIHYDADGQATVVDGPFAETKELIAGFWLLEVSSREEALEWMRRAPFRNGSVEVRRVFELEDLGQDYVREAEDRLRATTAEQRG